MADENKDDPPPSEPPKKKPNEIPGDGTPDDGNPWNDGEAPTRDEIGEWFVDVIIPRTEEDGDLDNAIMTETDNGVLVRTTDREGNSNVYFTDGESVYFTSDSDAYNAPPSDGLF
jgi:hypothetical protein